MTLCSIALRRLVAPLLVLSGLVGSAGAVTLPPTADQVFHLTASRTSAGALVLDWTIAPGNYLYRSSLEAAIGGTPLQVETASGETKEDPNFGTVEIYHGHAEATIARPPASGSVLVSARGCAEQGICYPAVEKTLDVATLAVSDTDADPVAQSTSAQPTPPAGASTGTGDLWTAPPPSLAATEGPLQGIMQGSTVAMLTAFLAFGVLLAFTPCVFPMLPILSAMLAGSGTRLSLGRSAVLSASYVIAAAAAYGAIGLIAGWTGANLQISLQNPYVLGGATLVFLLLALSMFGVFEIRLPAFLQPRASTGDNRPGSIVGAAALGFGSALVVSPCVTPPLAAAMLYAAETGNALKGGAALFALGLGMGMPLVVIGTLGTRFLPKSGQWLAAVRPVFGVAFLGVAILIASRLVPPPLSLALWGGLALGCGVYMGAFDRPTAAMGGFARLRFTTAIAAALYGGLLVVGAAGGGDDPLRPLGFLTRTAPSPASASIDGTRVTSLAALSRTIADAAGSRPRLISFTADSCTTCKTNDAVLDAPDLRAELSRFTRISADVTTSNTDTRQLMARYGVVGPPTLFLVDAEGKEIPGSRVTGPLTEDALRQTLSKTGS